MNRFGFTKEPSSTAQLAQWKGEDPIRKYEKEKQKQRLNSESRDKPGFSKAGAGLAGFSRHPSRPNLKDFCPEADSVQNVTRGRARETRDALRVRAPRRSRSVNSIREVMNPQPEPTAFAFGMRPQRKMSHEKLNPDDLPGSLRKFHNTSKSLVSLEVYENHKNGSFNNRRVNPETELSDKVSEIAWYLNQFGYYNSMCPTYFCLKYYAGLTGREYLEICRFVESQLGDALLEGHKETDEEIIAILIAFAVDMNYPVPITRTLLIAPMAPAMRPRTVCFLLWLCSRVYKINYRGSEDRPKTREIYFEGVTDEQIACRVFLQIHKTEEFNSAKHKEEYREYQRKLLSTDLKTSEELLKKRNEMKETLVKAKKRHDRELYEIQVLREDSMAASQRLKELEQRIQAKKDANSKLKEVEERKKTLLIQSMRLGKEVRELEETDELRTKVDKSEIKEIQKKIQAVETTIKEQMAIQKRSKEMLEVKEDLKNKLSQGCEEFIYNTFPALNNILKAIGMEPIELGLPDNCDNFLEQIMCENCELVNFMALLQVIGKTVEVAEEVLTMLNDEDNERSESFDYNENEVFVSCNTSTSEDAEDTIIPAGPSGSQNQALGVDGQVAKGEAADGEKQEQEGPYTALSRKPRRVYFEEDAQ